MQVIHSLTSKGSDSKHVTAGAFRINHDLQVMPFSTACSTTLSNFEAGLNYKDVSDPAVMVSFPFLDDEHDAHFVAWTTTPWTLPSNLALCVHPEFDYVKVKSAKTGQVLIVAANRVAFLPGGAPKKKKKGARLSQLAGLRPRGGYRWVRRPTACGCRGDVVNPSNKLLQLQVTVCS